MKNDLKSKEIKKEIKKGIKKENNISILKSELIFSIITLIIFTILMIFNILFLFNFQVSPNNLWTLILFIISTILYVSITISIEKLLSVKEIKFVNRNNKNKNRGNDQPNSNKRNIFIKFFKIIEDFPYEGNYKGKTRNFIKFIGWFTLIFIFILAVIVKEAILEFQTFNVNLIHWTQYFGFFTFVCLSGCLILFLYSKEDLSGIIKLSIVGVAIIIQVEVLIDYFFFPWRLPYDYVSWNHLFKAFFTLLLDPELSYAAGIGHTVLVLLLFILSFSYIFIKRNKALNINNNKKYIFLTLRGFIGGFNFYMITIYAAIMFRFCEVFLMNFLPLNPSFYSITCTMVSIIYFLPFFFLIIFKIGYDEKVKNNTKMELIKDYIKENPGDNINRTENQKWLENIRRKYKPKFLIKSFIFLLIIIIWCIIIFLTVWVFPNYIFFG
ncbi:MAG: hypothetical protein GF329_12190 [Candidatus Lokiarchaeota archaeon]|nr:hypothetical protein [Candidatus Lokiarchaeota archaeon]